MCLLQSKIMMATDVPKLESKYQDLASTTGKLADELTELRHRSLYLMKFCAFQPQESRLLSDALRDAINTVNEHDPQSWLEGMRNNLLTSHDYAIDIISLRKPGQRPLLRAIELLHTAENRTEKYKREVTEQSEDCTSTFARATSNKAISDSLARHINNYRDRTSAEISPMNKKLSSSIQELKENKKSLRIFHMIENDAQRKEERWKKVRLRVIEIIKRQWQADIFEDPQVDQAFSGYLSCNEGDLLVCAPARFNTIAGKELIINRSKEESVEEASAWVEEAKLEVERVQEERDELNTQLAALRSTANRASELSSHNHDLCDQSKRMMQACKELAAGAENMRRSSRQVLMQLSAIDDQMMLLSKTRGERLGEQRDRIKETLLSIQAAIEPIFTGRRLTNLSTARMLTLDPGHDKIPSLNTGIGGL